MRDIGYLTTVCSAPSRSVQFVGWLTSLLLTILEITLGGGCFLPGWSIYFQEVAFYFARRAFFVRIGERKESVATVDGKNFLNHKVSPLLCYRFRLLVCYMSDYVWILTNCSFLFFSFCTIRVESNCSYTKDCELVPVGEVCYISL